MNLEQLHRCITDRFSIQQFISFGIVNTERIVVMIIIQNNKVSSYSRFNDVFKLFLNLS